MEILAGLLFMAMQISLILLAVGIQRPHQVWVPFPGGRGQLVVVILYLGLAILFLVLGVMVKEGG